MAKKKKIIKPNDPNGLIYNKWIDCTDENYWQTERDMCAVVIAGEMYYMCRDTCPYGWNILVKNNGQFFTPIEATIEEHFMSEEDYE